MMFGIILDQLSLYYQFSDPAMGVSFAGDPDRY